MKLTRETERLLLEQIHEHPSRAIVLPDWCYWTGRDQPIVYIDGLPVSLSRHLYRKVIGEIPYATKLIQRESIHPRNVNPLLFLAEPHRSRGEACPNGHQYEGNEMPDNTMGYRCRTCYLAWLERNSLGRMNAGQVNAAKTHCPRDHPYDEENTMHLSNGRRRCRTCHRAQVREYRASRAA